MAQDRSAERPWLAAYPPGIPADIDVDAVGTVVDLFDRSVLRFAERPAITCFGASLRYREVGAAAQAVAAWLAAQVQPRALVILSGFVSVPELGQEVYPFLPVKWLARFRYATADFLKDVSCPVLVAHSRDDEVVPFRHGERLYAVAPGPKSFLELQGGHNEAFFFVRPEWERSLAEFLDSTRPVR